MEKKIQTLKNILEDSHYTVALSGSGMMVECGYIGMKTPEKAYEIELKYGESPEDIFTSVYYNNRTAKFFEFYKEEVLLGDVNPGPSAKALAKMEEQGRLQCIITSNIYELPQKGGCKNVINLHGSIYDNYCPHCGEKYTLDYVKNSKKLPLCEKCNHVIRPGVALFGEMMDSQLMSRAVGEIENAEVLLLLGTSLGSEVFSKYIRYFEGKKLVVIHKNKHHLDNVADLTILDEPKNVLPLLGY